MELCHAEHFKHRWHSVGGNAFKRLLYFVRVFERIILFVCLLHFTLLTSDVMFSAQSIKPRFIYAVFLKLYSWRLTCRFTV